MFSWRASETRPASSSPAVLGTIVIADQAIQSILHFSFDDFAIDSVGGVSFPVCCLAFGSKEWFCKKSYGNVLLSLK